MINPDGPVTTDPIILNQVKVGFRKILPAFVAQTSKIEVVQSRIIDDLIYEMTAYVLQQHVAELHQEVSIDVPASWWQHFKRDKHRWLPKWFVKRYPVKTHAMTKTFYLNAFKNYPDAKYALPPETFGRPVLFERLTESNWE